MQRFARDRTKAASPSKATVFYDRLPPCPSRDGSLAPQHLQSSGSLWEYRRPGVAAVVEVLAVVAAVAAVAVVAGARDEAVSQRLVMRKRMKRWRRMITRNRRNRLSPPVPLTSRKMKMMMRARQQERVLARPLRPKRRPKKAASAPKAKAKATAKAATKAKAKATPKAKGKAGKKGKLAKEEEEHEVPSNKRKRSDPAPKVTAKPKTKAAAKPAGKNGAADAAADKKAERSRKSVAYHRAVKEAKQSWKDR